MLILENIIHWAGVVDELEFAKSLLSWCKHGFPELGDTVGRGVRGVLAKVMFYRVIMQPISPTARWEIQVHCPPPSFFFLASSAMEPLFVHPSAGVSLGLSDIMLLLLVTCSTILLKYLMYCSIFCNNPAVGCVWSRVSEWSSWCSQISGKQVRIPI